MLSSSYLNALKTMALTEKQKVCENILVKTMVGAMRTDKRRIDELRVVVGNGSHGQLTSDDSDAKKEQQHLWP